MDKIIVKGARTHNLKNIDLEIPRDKLTVITGLSGSGKSSLAFDTLYAEGQRRYVESLSSYARQFLSLMDKPEVDHIEGLSPAISIEQKTTSHNPRSTVGTVTEIYDYLRVLFARIGEPRCPVHKVSLKAQTVSQMVDHTLAIDDDEKLMILAPVISDKKGEHVQLIEKLYAEGYLRARINGKVCELSDVPPLDRYKKHTIEVVVDRFKPQAKNKQRLAESFETALDLSAGIARLVFLEKDAKELVFSSKHACPHCHYSLKELTPRLFSFNSPSGACPSCDGLGTKGCFDVDKIILNPALSIKQGAIQGWDRRNGYYFAQLQALAAAFDFSLDTPYARLTEEQKSLLLNGSGKTKIEVQFKSASGRNYHTIKPFEGVLVNFARRFRETDSAIIREELAKLMSELPCEKCHKTRLNEGARNVFIEDKNIADVTALSIEEAHSWLAGLSLEGQRKIIAERLLKEILARLGFLVNVGLSYLNLSRQADTLSGGEAQRIRLASQIGAGLVGVMYILDEPSIGLHQRDNQKLLDTLHHLRDLGNTVIVVEHDEEAIKQADHIIDIGPGAGIHGGRIIAEGRFTDILSHKTSLTAAYLSGRKQIAISGARLKPKRGRSLEIIGASGNNLHKVDLKLPIGLLTCVTGVSGSGKSTLINQTLYPLAARVLNRNVSLTPKPYQKHKGFEHLDKVIDIDQSPIGRTPRSNPATYTGVFTPIRELFAATAEARSRGYEPGRFSFNVKGGRCEACQGDGVLKVEMHFLPDVYVACDVCEGKRYNRETLEVCYKDKNISDVLNMSIEEACDFFAPVPQINRRLQTLMDVGLAYLTLGQNATTLSGGEAQRIKLAKELSKTATGKTLYILDEPTTGLHFHDIQQLLNVIMRLRAQGNTIVIIEHNLDVIKMADWVIDLGPEGGDGGGRIIAAGAPESLVENVASHTGAFLKHVLV